jgi:uncharacterized protein
VLNRDTADHPENDIGHKLPLELGVRTNILDRVCRVVEEVSFRGAREQHRPSTLEGQIAQDADWFDALGAVGIARARVCLRRVQSSADMFYQAKSQFFTRISPPTSLPTRRRLTTFTRSCCCWRTAGTLETARALAESSHEYMLEFLKIFEREWEANPGAS